MFRQLVRDQYAIAVEMSQYATPELKRSLKTSERVPAFVDRLAEELARADAINRQRGVKVKKENIILLIHSMIDNWLFMLEENARQRRLSDIDRKAIETEMDEKWNPEKCIREMGIATDDENLANNQNPEN